MYLVSIFFKIIVFNIIQFFFWELLTFGLVGNILGLMLIFFLASFFLFFLNIEFFGLIYLLVYVGAVITLFIFVILMLDVSNIFLEKNNYNYSNLFFIFFIALNFVLIFFDLCKLEYLNFFFNTNFLYYDWLNYTFLKYNGYLCYKNGYSLSRGILDFGYILYEIYPQIVVSAGIFLLVSLVGALSLLMKK